MKNDSNTKTVSESEVAPNRTNAIETLKQLHNEVLKGGVEQQQRNPAKGMIIAKAMIRDLERINYVTNLLKVKKL